MFIFLIFIKGVAINKITNLKLLISCIKKLKFKIKYL